MDDPLNGQTATVQRGISGYDWLPGNDLIKVVAMILMVIDHVAWAFSRHPDVWRALGRGSFPLFAALLVVGMRRTRSPRRYLMRLALFALVSQFPFALCFRGLNIGFTLAIGGLALYVGEDILERNRQTGRSLRGWLGWSASMVAAGISASLLRTDYGGMGILAMALLQRSPTAWVGIPLMMGWTALFGWLRHWWVATWGALVVGAAFLLGWWLRDWKRRFLPRWIVYAFYPVHLTIIGVVLAAWGPGGQSKQPAQEPVLAAVLEYARALRENRPQARVFSPHSRRPRTQAADGQEGATSQFDSGWQRQAPQTVSQLLTDGLANAMDHRQATKRVPNRDVSRLGAQTSLAAATRTRAGGIRHRVPTAPPAWVRPGLDGNPYRSLGPKSPANR